MSVLIDRARMTVASAPGTGTISLGIAAAGQLTLAQAGVANGQSLPYGIQDGAAWEVGMGTYTTTGLTLTRGPLFSSLGGGAITATVAAQVYLTLIGGGVPTPAIAAGLVGTGTTQGTALPLTALLNILASCPPTTGFILATGVSAQAQNNDASNVAPVYPPSGAQINALGANIPYAIPLGGIRVSFSTNAPASQWWAG